MDLSVVLFVALACLGAFVTDTGQCATLESDGSAVFRRSSRLDGQ